MELDKKRKLSTDLSNSVEAYLQETGLNAQLIAKNDKKLIKLNLTKYNYKSNVNELKPVNNNNSIIDDLPTESDLSTCTTIILPSKSTSLEDKLNETNDNSSDSEQLKKKLKKKLFICNECGRQFYSQNDLNKHMLQLHEMEKPFECSQCHMSFLDVSSKRRHEKEHLGYKPFRCYICSFEFTRASNLRAHLLKVHPMDIGKSVSITKSIDNKLKFEFNLDEINNQKSLKPSTVSTNKTSLNQQSKLAQVASKDNKTNNKVVYIKDPNNKNAEIQHMIVYVDGKPIFVQNPAKTTQNEPDNTAKPVKTIRESTMSSLQSKKPVAKIPYLLALAANSAASNHRQQQIQKFQHQNFKLLSNESSLKETNNNKHSETKPDQEYLQLVSLFKQKNEKLFNPLI